MTARDFEWTLPSAPDAFGCNPLLEGFAYRWAASGGQLPVQPERRRNRGIHYKGETLARGVLRRHLDGCGMLPEWLLLLAPTAQSMVVGKEVNLVMTHGELEKRFEK